MRLRPSNPDTQVAVRNAADESRYILEVDGVRIGLADYRIRKGTNFFVHTEVDPAFQGMGFGMTIARFALDDVKKLGVKVVPICPLFAAFVKRNPGYNEMVNTEVLNRVLKARERAEEKLRQGES